MNLEQVCKGFAARVAGTGSVRSDAPEVLMLADAFEEAGEENVARYLRERLECVYVTENNRILFARQDAKHGLAHYADPVRGCAYSRLCELLEAC